MPLVFAKSKMDREHVMAKKEIGCDGIEYQMLASDFNGARELISPEMCLSVVEEHPAHAIHLPMNDCNVEDDIGAVLEYVVQLAEHSALIWASMGKDVEPIVVLHNEQHFSSMDGNKRTEIEVMLDSMLGTYPHVQFAVENTTPFRWLQKMSTRLSSGYFDSPVMLVEHLRRVLATDRIGTCLDTCHAKITERTMRAVTDLCPEANLTLSMEGYFEKYLPTCKLLHFASYEGSGYGAGHATPYTKEKQGELEEEVGLYRRLGYECPITLEINEKDLLACDGYAQSKKNLQRAWKKANDR